ncbi:MAG: biopolymer transporter ExbD [Gammaproteobacteria bacterium]|nr:biopolymer transporter ExbD [Gammaproteobacteria bacterium]
MKRLYRQNDDESAIDITPMLDIVFIMLIFFVVTTSFVKESGIDVNRPSASTAERKETGSILVAISMDNNVWIDKRRIDPDAIRPNIERLHAENPEGAVVIQADKASTSGLLVKVMDQIRLAGVTNISIAAQAKRD